MDTRKRSVAKTVTWRVAAALITIIALGLITGEWSFAAGAGIVINVIKVAVYYVHERAWNIVQWGRSKDGHKEKLQARIRDGHA